MYTRNAFKNRHSGRRDHPAGFQPDSLWWQRTGKQRKRTQPLGCCTGCCSKTEIHWKLVTSWPKNYIPAWARRRNTLLNSSIKW